MGQFRWPSLAECCSDYARKLLQTITTDRGWDLEHQTNVGSMSPAEHNRRGSRKVDSLSGTTSNGCQKQNKNIQIHELPWKRKRNTKLHSTHYDVIPLKYRVLQNQHGCPQKTYKHKNSRRRARKKANLHRIPTKN